MVLAGKGVEWKGLAGKEYVVMVEVWGLAKMDCLDIEICAMMVVVVDYILAFDGDNYAPQDIF